MSVSNENSPFLVVVPLGSISANASLPALYLPKKCFISSVTLMDVTGIVASDSNYVDIRLQNGSTVIAEIDSRAAHENGIAALTGEPLNMVAAEQAQAAGSSLKVVYAETGTVAMTNAVLVVEMYAV